MRSLADTHDAYVLQSNLTFLNRLLQLQNAYYEGNSKAEVLKKLLLELCEITGSVSAGLINNKDRLQDLFVNGAQRDLIHATIRGKNQASAKAYHIRKVGTKHILVCDIKDATEITGMIYLVSENTVFTQETYTLIKPVIPILKGMLAFMELYLKTAPELDLQSARTAGLQSLIESLDDVILELDNTMTIRKVWVKDKSKLFMPPETFIDKTLTEVFGGFADVFIECIEKLLLTGERQECIYPDFDLNKDNWYCAKFQKIDTDPKEVRIICVIEDITTKKELSDQLQHNTQEFKRVNTLLDIGLDISKMGGWEYNLLSSELFVTRQIYDIQEYDHNKIITHRTVLDAFNHENKVYLLNTLKEAFEQKTAFNIKLELTENVAHKKWVRLAGMPVIENDRVQAFRGILKDITEHKNNEEELIRAKNLAEQIARKRTEILSIMSHEIRTPLNGIIGICNLLEQNKLADDAQTAEYIGHLSFSSNHLLNLVNDILDLEKIENRKMELNETETDLVALVGNIRKQFIPLAKAKNLLLKFTHDHKLPALVRVDDLRLGRILNNLIGNAIKFTEKGEVSISLKTIRKDKEMVSVRFRIADTGIGIAEHLHHLIFDKFHQVQQAAYRQQQGTGLGLSITKGLINLFKSEIHLDSKVNEGTVFEFEIEFAVAEGPEAHKKQDFPVETAQVLPEFRLLIVDDNPINLLVAKRQLNHFGVEADQADNGYTALEMLKQQDYEVILIDLHMPEMDGYQLARRVQIDHPATRIIVFTADILDDVRGRLQEMGIFHVLSKPFNPDVMHRLLIDVMNSKV